MGLGTDPALFFRLTPRLFDMAVAGHVAAITAAHDRQIDLAWLNASLGRVKRMPALSKLKAGKARGKAPAKAMAWQDMYAAAAGWAASAGTIATKED